MNELYGIQKESFTSVYEAWKSVIHPDDMKKSEAED
jgi:hypothetical protein